LGAELPAHQGIMDPPDPPDLQVHQAMMVQQELKVLQVQESQAHLVIMVRRARLVLRVHRVWEVALPDLQGPLVLQAWEVELQVLQVLLA
jgi:hypothetical protein